MHKNEIGPGSSFPNLFNRARKYPPTEAPKHRHIGENLGWDWETEIPNGTQTHEPEFRTASAPPKPPLKRENSGGAPEFQIIGENN
jgi:hypothetical protein